MTRVMVVADSGAPMAALTRSLDAIETVTIVRHASARAPVTALVRRHAPEVVLIDEIHWPRLVLSRVEEIVRDAPKTAVVVLTSRADADWLADALRSGAAAVVPRDLEPTLLARVLDEAVAAPYPRPIARAA